MILEIFRLSKSNDKIKDLNTLKDVSCADNKLCKNHIQNIFTDKKDYLCYAILVSGVHLHMYIQTECLQKNVRYVKIKK